MVSPDKSKRFVNDFDMVARQIKRYRVEAELSRLPRAAASSASTATVYLAQATANSRTPFQLCFGEGVDGQRESIVRTLHQITVGRRRTRLGMSAVGLGVSKGARERGKKGRVIV